MALVRHNQKGPLISANLLRNLCSCKPTLSLVSTTTPKGSWTPLTDVSLGRMNVKSALLNEDTVGRLIILGSKSFYLVTQKVKKVL